MTPAERGYLLLCCDLADSSVFPLTPSQLRHLRQRMRQVQLPAQPDRELKAADITALGVDRDIALRMERLLNREPELNNYLRFAQEYQIKAITCASPGYPRQLLERLGDYAPPVLFCRGDTALLEQRCVALVGSRWIAPANKAFAAHIGALAAREGYTLVSGNAIGADQAGQEACLAGGGSVISFLPDRLLEHQPAGRQLLVSVNSFHAGFSRQRALQRNTLIHSMAEKVFVAQSAFGHGGTWSGTTENLRRGLSEVYVYNDHSPAAQALIDQGATPVPANLPHLGAQQPDQMGLFL